jgi:[histone H3]-lysine4 N-trimethyltransferase SETD1
MSRDSRGNYADYFPNAPTVLHQKRKKPSYETRPVAAFATSLTWTSPALQARKQRSEQQHYGAPHNSEDKAKANAVGEEDDVTRGDSGDLLNGVGSASSHASTASSVFSNAQPTASSYAGNSSSLHALTPMTNTSYSPPGKLTSPQILKGVDGSVQTLGLQVEQDAQDSSEAITPVQTPPEPREQARPGPGEEKGFILRYDPELDREITKEQRKKRRAEPKVFGLQVGHVFLHSSHRYNIIVF